MFFIHLYNNIKIFAIFNIKYVVKDDIWLNQKVIIGMGTLLPSW